MNEPHKPHHPIRSVPAPRSNASARGLRRILSTCLAAGAMLLSLPACQAQGLGLRFEAGYMLDDNVTRARKGGNDVLGDNIFSVNATKTFMRPIGQNVRATLGLQAGGEKFVRYDGLTRLTYGGNVGIQYRPSGNYLSPTFTVFGRWLVDRYESDLRDGFRYAAGVMVRQPLTDRIEVSGTAQYNRRDGRSTVFDGSDWSVRLNLDYALPGRHTLYASGEYRRGDAVSVGVPWLAMIDIAKSLVQDDVFTDRSRFAYRFDADTVIATIGYNWPLGTRQSLDFSWRWIQTTPTTKSTTYASTIEYRVNQFSAAYLVRF